MGKLENKTKAQLIEIIMRKDDVENELRKEVNDLTQKYDALKADYEDVCDADAENNQQNAEYEKLRGDYNTLKLSYEHAIKDCRDMSNRLEDVSANLANVQDELAEVKKQRDAWLATTIISVVITCVVLCLC